MEGESGFTALMAAAERDNSRVVEILLRAGADPALRNSVRSWGEGREGIGAQIVPPTLHSHS